MKKRTKKRPLTARIFIGLAGGLLTGILFNLFIPAGYVRDILFINGIFYLLGNGFVRFMKMLVVPLVFCSLVCGCSSMSDPKTLGKIGVKTLLFYLATTVVAVALAIGVGSILKPGIGLDLSAAQTAETTVTASSDTVETLLNIIPENPFRSLSEGDMLQVILFALILGVLLAKMGERASSISRFMTQFNDLMAEMTDLVMSFAPVGVFCTVARTFANLGFDAFLPLLKYMGSVTVGLTLQCLLVYLPMLLLFTGLDPLIFLKKYFPVMVFAFSTSSSNASIPMSVDTLTKKLGVSESIASFTVPLGATVHMDGTSIMQGVAVMFAAQAYGVHLGVTGYLTVIASATLASVGTAGVPSVGLITLSMVFASAGLPVEAIALIMGVDRILDMLRTSVNVAGDAVCTAIVAHQNGDLDREIYRSAAPADRQTPTR